MMCERSCVVRLIASTVGKFEVVFIKVGGIMDLGNKSRDKVSASVTAAFKAFIMDHTTDDRQPEKDL